MNNTKLHCSFCGKSQDAVQKLISSPKERPDTYICDECVTVCVKILDDDSRPPVQPQSEPPTSIPRWFAQMLGAHKPE